MNHPLIKNANQYFLEKKYVSIHSSDINISKYPNTAEFEVSLPQDLLNVASVRLYSWDFPGNLNVVSELNNNLKIAFRFTTLYNPGEVPISDPLLDGIFAAIYHNINNDIIITIQPGNYSPQQIAIELTNRFNEETTLLIKKFLNDNPEYSEANSLFTKYNRFKIVYNEVSEQLWFGNNADGFMIINESSIYSETNHCIKRNHLPEWSNWGLPSNLGFTRSNEIAFKNTDYPNSYSMYMSNLENEYLPRFYYDTTNNGFWLMPELIGANVYFLKTPFKINLNAPKYIYMEVSSMNNIDETSPWNNSTYTTTHSQNNANINSAFAKIPINNNNSSGWYDNDTGPYKFWNPPAERIGKLKIKFRNHNGMLVDFGLSEFSFVLEFNLLKPQQEKIYSVVNAYDLSQQQNFSKN